MGKCKSSPCLKQPSYALAVPLRYYVQRWKLYTYVPIFFKKKIYSVSYSFFFMVGWLRMIDLR